MVQNNYTNKIEVKNSKDEVIGYRHEVYKELPYGFKISETVDFDLNMSIIRKEMSKMNRKNRTIAYSLWSNNKGNIVFDSWTRTYTPDGNTRQIVHYDINGEPVSKEIFHYNIDDNRSYTATYHYNTDGTIKYEKSYFNGPIIRIIEFTSDGMVIKNEQPSISYDNSNYNAEKLRRIYLKSKVKESIAEAFNME
ncbi:MAG: hypothetical protein QMC67_13180 [Candidatus Wallbacteria bacterium]